MASVREKNGHFYYRFTVRVGDKYKYIEKGTFATKEEALEAGNKAEQEYVYIPPKPKPKVVKSLTFKELSQEWLKHCEYKYKGSSLIVYKNLINSLATPIIGTKKIKDITTKHCQEIIDKAIKRKIAYRSILQIKFIVTDCFKYAIHEEYINHNPSTDVLIPAKRTRIASMLDIHKEPRCLTKKELQIIFNRYPEGSMPYIPLLLGYKAGLRLSEVFGVMMEDFDYERRILYVRRQMQYDDKSNVFFSDLKYCRHGEFRTVYLDEETAEILHRHICKIKRMKLEHECPEYYIDEYNNISDSGKTKINPIVIDFRTHKMAKPRDISRIAKVIHGYVGKLKEPIPDWCFHAMRHTHASECLAAGMSPTSLQKRLGHKNLTTTLTTYVHETEEEHKLAKSVLDSMYR